MNYLGYLPRSLAPVLHAWGDPFGYREDLVRSRCGLVRDTAEVESAARYLEGKPTCARCQAGINADALKVPSEGLTP